MSRGPKHVNPGGDRSPQEALAKMEKLEAEEKKAKENMLLTVMVYPPGAVKGIELKIFPYGRLIVQLHSRNGGSTFSMRRWDLSDAAEYAVGVHPDRTQVLDHPPTERDVCLFVDANRDLLRDPAKSVGTWFESATGKHWLDVSTTLADREVAVELARKHNQTAIFDLARKEEIQTGGIS